MNTTSHNNEHPSDDQLADIEKSLWTLIRMNEQHKLLLLQAYPELSANDERFSKIDFQISQLKLALQSLS
jgi:hypothetical protein